LTGAKAQLKLNQTAAKFQHNNKHPMGCEAQLAWKCLHTRTVFGRQFWPIKDVILT